MNWNEYLGLSEKTLSTQFHCEKRDELLLHAVMGILTEVEELTDNHIDDKHDIVNISEEVGDITWYLAIIGRELNLQFPQDVSSVERDPIKLIMLMTKDSCKMLDIMKKKLFYNKAIQDDIFVELSNKVFNSLIQYMMLYSINIEKSFDINIAKLKARYGEKFSSERAIDRDLTTERKILEDK